MSDAVLEADMRRTKWWLIVTGTGRCGTGYIMQVLNGLGVKCSHEGIFTPHHTPDGPVVPPGLVRDDEIRARIRTRLNNAWWGWQAASSWLAAPYLDLPELKDMKVVHLVRDTRKVVNSQLHQGGFENRGPLSSLYYEFQLQHEPGLADLESQLERAAYFNTRWNARIEPHADILWRVEDDVRGLLDLLEIDYQGKELFCDTSYNTYGQPQSDVDLNALPKLLRGELREMTERYGYDWT